MIQVWIWIYTIISVSRYLIYLSIAMFFDMLSLIFNLFTCED